MDRHVQVREFRLSREADRADPLARAHAGAPPHRNAAALHVAVLGMPPAAVVDAHAVAAFPALDHGGARAAHADVPHPVSRADYPAVCGGSHRDALAQPAGVCARAMSVPLWPS